MDQMKTMSRSSQLLAGAGLLLFIFLFFDWQQVTQILGVRLPELPVKTVLISTGLAALVLLFTVIKFLVDNEARHWPAWVGLILAIAIGLGGFLRWSGDAAHVWERPAQTPPAA
jgi:hypothetical protein